ncbi:MAG: toxic anion resistance protein [Candidatus Dormibacteria bacterium]
MTPGPAIEPPGQDLGLAPAVVADVDREVEEFVARAQEIDGRPGTEALLVEAVDSLGTRDMRAVAALSGRLLERPAAAMLAFSGDGGSVGMRLDELRRMAGALQTEAAAMAREPQRRLLGMLPPRAQLDPFIVRSERAHENVQAVLDGLGEAEQGLRSDNAAIAQELTALATQIEALRRHAYMATRIHERFSLLPGLSASIGVLFAVQQRRRDILMQLAIAMQGFAALRVVEENNAGLIRSIAGATTTTAAALRMSEVVQQAMLTQRLVRTRLNDAHHAAESGEAGSTSHLAILSAAWAGVEATLAQVYDFRVQALNSISSATRSLSSHLEGAPPAS